MINQAGKKMTDEKPELLFSDLRVGRSFRPLTYQVTRQLVDEFMDTVGDRNSLYSAEGPSIAPPGLAAIYARLSYLQDHAMPAGGVLAKQEFEFHNSLRVGETISITAKVIESRLDEKQRKRVVFFIEAKDQDNAPVSVIRLHAIWPK
jgi:acyl dehydratase